VAGSYSTSYLGFDALQVGLYQGKELRFAAMCGPDSTHIHGGPEETLMTGDSKVDVQTAHNAGAWSLGCASDSARKT
jgi:phosphoglycolate phosphatase-like HAD superfamily hydrolase